MKNLERFLGIFFITLSFFAVHFVTAQVGDVAPSSLQTCTDLQNNLQYRMTDARTGGEVSLLQDFLNPQYLSSEPTGFFGKGTLAAVKQFQADNGLLNSGYAGPITRAKIKDLTCGQGSADSTNTTTATNSSGGASVSIAANGSRNSITVTSGSSATLTWKYNGVSACGLSGTSGNVTFTGDNAASTGPLTQPVTYTIRCSPSDGSGYVTDSVTVNVSSGTTTASSGDKLSVSYVSGNKNTYAPGEKINLSIKGVEESDGSPGEPSEGFNIQMYLRGLNDSYSLQGVNATYNRITKYWDAQLTTPTDSSKTYVVESSFYCSNGSLKCGKLYSAADQETISFKFTLTNITSTSGGIPDVYATPTQGSAPLTVAFSVLNSRSTEENGIYYTITFGDGEAAGFSRSAPFTLPHTYNSSGTYTAVVTERTQCSSWECLGPSSVIRKVVITVNSSADPANPDSLPTAVTSAASNITGTTATLNGTVNSAGTTGTIGWFRGGASNPGKCDDTFGVRIPSTGGTSFTSGYSRVSFSRNVTGLTPGVTYYYCAIAQNSSGGSYGSVVSFTALSAGTTGSSDSGSSGSSSAAAPTCSLSADKNSYTYGDTIVLSWKSRNNATYAAFQQDTSGKDTLWLPGDKLAANGSQSVTANVIGSPTITLLVYSATGSGSCNISVPVYAAVNSPAYTSDQYRIWLTSTYQTLLGRAPDQNGLNYYLERLTSGTETMTQVYADIAGSPEANTYVANSTFLSNVYQAELGRSPDTAGRDYYLDKLRSGSMTQAQVKESIHNSPEAVRYRESQTTSYIMGESQIAGVFLAIPGIKSSENTKSQLSYQWDKNLEIGSPYPTDVSALQTALSKEGLYNGEISGGFYVQTFIAVKDFQKKYGIEATGFVGPATRAKLNELY